MDEPQMVPLAALEAESARHSKTLRTVLVCWAVSVAFLCSALMVSVSSEEVTETSEVTQSADNSGNNSYVEGDSYGG